jgi:serine/threonine protein kinase
MKNNFIGKPIRFESEEVVIEKHLKTTATEEIFLTTGCEVVKYVPIYTRHALESYQSELGALKLLQNSSNIIELKNSYFIQSSPIIGLLKLEYCEEGSLLNLLKNHSFNEEQILQIMKDLLTAVARLEETGILHRSISLKNILVTNDYRFILSGFGNSVLLQGVKSLDSRTILSNIEKILHPYARPPDFKAGFSIEKIDIWSVGCVLHILLFREYPIQNQQVSSIQNETLLKILSLCLNPNPKLRPTALSMLFHIQQIYEFNLASCSSQLSFPSRSILKCCYYTLDDSVTTPDLYFIQTLTSKIWTSPEKVEKVLEVIRNFDKNLTISSIKILLLLHKIMISGPASTTNCADIIESVLKTWQNNKKNNNDACFCEFYSGLIRQLCRVLLDKINLHRKSGVPGNWKQMIDLIYLEDTLEYLLKVVKICEGLSMDKYGLQAINNFLKSQLIEECQKVIGIVNSVLNANNKFSQDFSDLVQRINTLSVNIEEPKVLINEPVNKPPEPTIPDFSQYNQIPEFPQPNQYAIQVQENFLDNRWKIVKEDLITEKVLAGGSSCTVYKGKYKYTPVAIKIMKGTFMGKSLEKEFEREVTAMITLRHPNLVLFMGASKSPQMIIVSEFCAGGSLFSLLHENKNVMISWKQKLMIIKHVARGMLYLHEAPSPILHRDLKSLNLLLAKPVTGPNDSVFIKITDFGVARIIEKNVELTGQMGTCHWMAPEVLNNQPYYLQADIYSYGIVVWEVIAREIPYHGTNPMTIPMRVVKGERPNLAQIPTSCPEVLKNLVRACWDANPSKRPNFNQILDILEKVESTYDL